MNTISDAHRQRLKALHDRDPNFGVIGHLWAPRIAAYIEEIDAKSFLDYGAGRSGLAGELAKRMGWGRTYHEYEPAFGHLQPMPAEFVACIDVLEHVEEDRLEAVLDDIKRCTMRAGLITVSLRNGTKAGRLTHPIIQPREWWLSTIKGRFRNTVEVPILNMEKAKSEVAMLVRVQ